MRYDEPRLVWMSLPIALRFLCVFITAVPITKLFAGEMRPRVTVLHGPPRLRRLERAVPPVD
jgi:hypothetical protein